MQYAHFSHSLRLAAPLAIALLALAPDASAAGVAPGAATPVQREQAQSRFLRGKQLYGAGQFDGALVEFSASLDIVASPNTRLYVARCQRELGRLVSAYVELGRTEIEAKELTRDDPRYEKAGIAAAQERKDLEPRLGFVEISVSRAAPATTMKIGDDEVRRGGWSEPIPVLPGTAEIVVETPGRAPVKRTVELAAGQRESLAIDAEADAPADVVAVADVPDGPSRQDGATDRSNLRPYAYVAGGVAAAGLATFTLFGVLANGTHSELEDACGNEACPPGHEDDISAGRTQQTIANVGLVVGAIGAAAAVTLFVISAPKKDAPASASASARLVQRGTFVGLEGSF